METSADRYTVYEVTSDCPDCGHLPDNRETRRWRAKKGRHCICGGAGVVTKYVPSHAVADLTDEDGNVAEWETKNG